jgi:hypothetical protein
MKDESNPKNVVTFKGNYNRGQQYARSLRSDIATYLENVNGFKLVKIHYQPNKVLYVHYTDADGSIWISSGTYSDENNVRTAIIDFETERKHMDKAPGIMITDPDKIRLAQMVARKGALRLECLGMKRSSGKSVYQIIKEEHGLTGNRASVYTQYCELVAKAKGEL